MSEYEKYQLQWMIDHGYSLNNLIKELQDMQNSTEDCDRLFAPISELFDEWVADVGFSSEIWACEEEWRDYEQPGCIITKELILSGIKERLITFGVDPNMGSGTVCRIGDGWFYFGGLTAEEMSPNEYLANVPMEDIVREIHETLDEFSRDEELRDEYEYYKSVLIYRNGYSG